MSSFNKPLARRGDKILFITHGGLCYQIDKRSGKTLWKGENKHGGLELVDVGILRYPCFPLLQ